MLQHFILKQPYPDTAIQAVHANEFLTIEVPRSAHFHSMQQQEKLQLHANPQGVLSGGQSSVRGTGLTRAPSNHDSHHFSQTALDTPCYDDSGWRKIILAHGGTGMRKPQIDVLESVLH